MTGQRKAGVGYQYGGRGVAEKSQGKDREGGGPVRLDNRKEGHQFFSYWDRVYRARAIIPVRQKLQINRGTGTYLIPKKRGAPPREKYAASQNRNLHGCGCLGAPKTGTSASPVRWRRCQPTVTTTTPPQIGMQTTDRPKRVPQDPQLRISLGTGGRDGAVSQEGSAETAEMQDDR